MITTWLSHITDYSYALPETIVHRLKEIGIQDNQDFTRPTLLKEISAHEGIKCRFEYLHQQIMLINNRFNAIHQLLKKLSQHNTLGFINLHAQSNTQLINTEECGIPSPRFM